jgi:4,5-DOPA dioxygenase extradiol
MPTMPALFLGHGNPMFALADNAFTRGWSAVCLALPRPSAILCVSAHWYIGETAVTAMAQPRTIHDFGGFPRELFECRYPAPGDPALAERVRALLEPVPVRLDQEWGLDHGTWAPLCKVYPQADIPVVQLSIDATGPPSFHYEVGQRLSLLRDEGVLLVGSGNVVHNLRRYAWDGSMSGPYDWALRFDTRVRELLQAGDDAALVEYEALGPDGRLAIPTPDHYLPLLPLLGARRADEPVTFPVEGFDGGSMSMLVVRFG